jgi:hypothetical protein
MLLQLLLIYRVLITLILIRHTIQLNHYIISFKRDGHVVQTSLHVSAFLGHHQRLPRHYLVSHSVQVHLYIILDTL